MKVVQMIPELNEGGVERGVVELNRELVLKGIESIVISAGGKEESQIESDGGKHIKFDVCSKNIFTVLPRVFALKKLLKDLAPDIVHVRSRVPAWLTYYANTTLGIKIISTVHGFNSISFYSKIMTRFDHTICVSNSIKEYIQLHYQPDDNKITVIPRGVDLSTFSPQNANADFIKRFSNKYDLYDRFVVSSVGRITQLKDYETFIKAISSVKKEKPSVKALIVGGVRSDKQEYLLSLKKLIKKLELEDNIIFTGSQKEIVQIYAISDVVVSCSKKPESFGRAVAEAIAMNTPVVATNHGGVKDIVNKNENGFLFEVGDSRELASSILKAQYLNFDGYNYIANNFSLKNMVEKTIKVYERVIK